LKSLSISFISPEIANSYTIELPAYAGPLSVRGELKSLSISFISPEIANSYTIELPADAGPLSARGELNILSISFILPEITNSYTIELRKKEMDYFNFRTFERSKVPNLQNRPPGLLGQALWDGYMMMNILCF